MLNSQEPKIDTDVEMHANFDATATVHSAGVQLPPRPLPGTVVGVTLPANGRTYSDKPSDERGWALGM